jgi:DNA-directed RNA polymerase subunit RPC12/RpoP
MGTARFETLMDFARREVDVGVRCLGCGYTRCIQIEQLEAVMGGWAVTVRRAERRLKCTKCGHRGARLAPVLRLDP